MPSGPLPIGGLWPWAVRCENPPLQPLDALLAQRAEAISTLAHDWTLVYWMQYATGYSYDGLDRFVTTTYPYEL